MQTYERFLTAVQLGTDTDERATECIARAVLTTLLERLSGGQADDLVQQLRPPPEVVSGTATLRNRPAESYDVEEFLRRVERREPTRDGDTRTHVSAVLQALRLVVSPAETADTLAQLPSGLADLGRAPGRPRHPAASGEELVRAVARRGDLALEEAGRVTEGVLEALAERLPDREVNELTLQLPDDLSPPLARGRARRTAPRGLDVDAFLDLVGERLTVDPVLARTSARTVLPELAAAVDDPVLADVLVQLPDGAADLFGDRATRNTAG